MFGDVVKDPTDEALYVAVSGSTVSNNKRQYIFFLRLTEEFHCLCEHIVPHDRGTTRKFIYIKNIYDSIEKYLHALEIKHDKALVSNYGFTIQRLLSQ